MPESLERCVASVKAKGGVDNAWAVCNAAMKGKRKRKKRKPKRSVRYAEGTETMSRKFSDDLIGKDSPEAMRSIVETSMQACMLGGSEKQFCQRQAMMAVHNAGWRQIGQSWKKTEPREQTFAEKMEEDGNVPLYFMRDVELMQPGTWRGIPFSDSDLRAIAAATNALHDKIKPMITLGHLEDDETRNAPAGGWIGDLYVDKNKSLRAKTITGIPAALAETIEHGGYRRLSVDLALGYQDAESGKKYPGVIKRAAFLGGTKPIIDTMEDLPQLYRQDGWRLAAAEGNEPLTVSVVALPDEGEGEQMPDLASAAEAAKKKADEEAAGAAKVKAEAENMEKIDPLALVREMRAEKDKQAQINEELRRELAEMKKDRDARDKRAARDVAAEFIDEMVRDGRVTPAERPIVENIAMSLAEDGNSTTLQFGEGGEMKTISRYEAFKQAILKRPKAYKFGESAPSPRTPVGQAYDGGLLKNVGTDAQSVEKTLKAIDDGTAGFGIDPTIAAIVKE